MHSISTNENTELDRTELFELMVQLRVEFQSYRFFSTVGITVSSRFRIDFYGFFYAGG